VRGDPQKDSSLTKTVLDQMEKSTIEVFYSYFKVTNSTVNKLGASAAGALPEVILFNESDSESPARGIKSNTASGGAAANHQQVLRFVPL